MNFRVMTGFFLAGMFFLLGVATVWADEPDAQRVAGGGEGGNGATNTSVDGSVGGPLDQQGRRAPEDEELKKRWYAALAVLAVGTSAIFLSMLLLALLRASRRYRRRLLGKKAEPTEYVDAWGQYRLKEDYDESDEDEC